MIYKIKTEFTIIALTTGDSSQLSTIFMMSLDPIHKCCQARDMNFPVMVLTFTSSPGTMYSGTWISRPVDNFAVLLRLVAEEPVTAGGV